MSNTNNAGKYLVDYTLTVDRPELRDSSYRPVPAGTKCALQARFATRAGALAFVAEIMAGQWDFAAEIVTSVRCTMDVNVRVSGGKSWREIVPRTARARQAQAA